MSSLDVGVKALQAVAKEMPIAERRSLTEATAAVTSSILVAQGRAGASSGRLRGVGRAGARIGVAGAVRDLTGVVRALGPAHLLDHDTKAHAIVPKRARALSTPFGPKSSAFTPGTSGKLYFEEGAAAAIPIVTRIFEANVDQALLKAVI